MRNIFNDFKDFALKGNVVDMAVGVIIGTAFGKIVASLVNDILMPPLGYIVGNMDFSDLALQLNRLVGSDKPVSVKYGLFINNVINFVIVAFCLFLIIKLMTSVKKKKK